MLTEIKQRVLMTGVEERHTVRATYTGQEPTYYDTLFAPLRDEAGIVVGITGTVNDITEPCAVDNLHKLRDAFQNEQGFVPAYYLFDAEGKLKSFAAGERGTALLGAALNRILGIQS